LYLDNRSSGQTIASPKTVNTGLDNAGSEASTEAEPAIWSNVAQSVWSDQRRIWIFPGHIARRGTWKPVLIIAGVTAGLVVADAPVSSYFRGNARFTEFDSVLGGRNTEMAMMAFPVSFCVGGSDSQKA
jgi:hypothetical protein